MRFLADTNITQTVIVNLRLVGHDVLDIKKQTEEKLFSSLTIITEESAISKPY